MLERDRRWQVGHILRMFLTPRRQTSSQAIARRDSRFVGDSGGSEFRIRIAGFDHGADSSEQRRIDGIFAARSGNRNMAVTRDSRAVPRQARGNSQESR
jgi:hypothetical protein